jgi:3-oxoacyl-[acyl-carrier-protein] synthase-3
MGDVSAALLEEHGLTPADVKAFIPHQANRRIITATGDRLGIDRSRVVVNIERYGNTTAATIPLATQDALNSGLIQKGDIVLFAAVGAGFTVGTNLWRWAF